MTKPVRRAERLPPKGRAWSAAAAAHRRWRMPPRQSEAPTPEAFVAALLASFATAERSETPYRHWILRRCLPDAAVAPIQALPFPPPALGGLSGRRELHDATRKYFDVANRARFPVCESLCQAFQDERVTARIAAQLGVRLAGTYLQVEYAQDTDGFWLEPHTGLGVMAFTMLLYMSSHPQHATLGTDLYNADKTHAGRAPFAANTALALVPSDIAYHGFERRRIEGKARRRRAGSISRPAMPRLVRRPRGLA
ncbi:MAG: 2OG-Fe(II) oxygenase [Hyphomicrobiaceae bacterium]